MQILQIDKWAVFIQSYAPIVLPFGIYTENNLVFEKKIEEAF